MILSRKYLEPAAIGVLLILHAVGAVGLQTASRDWFLALTPLNLLISGVLVFGFHREQSGKFLGLLTLSALAGYFYEFAGVHTGMIFGEYAYGETLGLKVGEVPLTIALNWAMLVYATGMVLRPMRIHWIWKGFGSAVLMVLLDVLIEPIAISNDFWSWGGGVPPLQNYVGWFLLSFVLCTIFHRMKFHRGNNVAVALFFIQVLFFGTLNLLQ